MFKNDNFTHLILFVLFIYVVFVKSTFLGVAYTDTFDDDQILFIINKYVELISFNKEAWNILVCELNITIVQILYRLPQVAISKLISYLFDIQVLSLKAFHIYGIFNLFVNISILIVSYKIFTKLGFSKQVAIAGVFVLSSLVNMNIYIMHIMPYDSSLLLSLIGLYIICNENHSIQKIFFSGFISALSFFDYHGNFLIYIIILLFCLIRYNRRFINKILDGILFISPLVILFYIFDLFVSSENSTFYNSLFDYSNTIKIGDTKENLLFVVRYFYQVENVFGIILIIILFVSIIHVNFIKSTSGKLFIIAGIVYILFGIQGLIFEKMVFYGRTLHQFVVFIVLGVLFLIQKYQNLSNYLILASLANLFWLMSDFDSVAFPKNTLVKFANVNLLDKYKFVNESISVMDSINNQYVNSDVLELKDKFNISDLEFIFDKNKINSDKIYSYINICVFLTYPYSVFHNSYIPYKPNPNEKLVFEKRHYMSHPAYVFEITDIKGREYFLNNKFNISVYEINK